MHLDLIALTIAFSESMNIAKRSSIIQRFNILIDQIHSLLLQSYCKWMIAYFSHLCNIPIVTGTIFCVGILM